MIIVSNYFKTMLIFKWWKITSDWHNKLLRIIAFLMFNLFAVFTIILLLKNVLNFKDNNNYYNIIS